MRRTLLLATGALSVLIAACGTGGPPKLAVVNPSGAIAALQATAAQHTAAVHLDMLSGVPGKAPHDQAGSGVWNFTNNTGRIDFAIPVKGGTGHQTFIQTGGTLYYGAGSYTPTQTQWFSMPAGSQAAGMAIGSTKYLDPTTALSVLQKATTVRSTGPGEYQATLPLADFGPLAPAPPGVQNPSADLPRTVKLFVTNGKVTKEVFSGPLAAGKDGSTFDQTITLDFSNFGVPVVVTPPPASQVTPGGAL